MSTNGDSDLYFEGLMPIHTQISTWLKLQFAICPEYKACSIVYMALMYQQILAWNMSFIGAKMYLHNLHPDSWRWPICGAAELMPRKKEHISLLGKLDKLVIVKLTQTYFKEGELLPIGAGDVVKQALAQFPALTLFEFARGLSPQPIRSEDIFRSSDSEHPGCHTKDQHYKQIAEALEFCFLWEAYTLRLRGSLHIPDAKGGTHHFLQTVAEHILLGIGQFLRFCNCRMQENSIRNVRGLTSSLSVEVWGVSPTTFSRLLRLSDLCCKLLVVMVEDFKSLSNLKDNKLTFLAACNLGLLLHLLHLIYIQIPAPTEEDDAVCQAARYVIHTACVPIGILARTNSLLTCQNELVALLRSMEQALNGPGKSNKHREEWMEFLSRFGILESLVTAFTTACDLMVAGEEYDKTALIDALNLLHSAAPKLRKLSGSRIIKLVQCGFKFLARQLRSVYPLAMTDSDLTESDNESLTDAERRGSSPKDFHQKINFTLVADVLVTCSAILEHMPVPTQKPCPVTDLSIEDLGITDIADVLDGRPADEDLKLVRMVLKNYILNAAFDNHFLFRWKWRSYDSYEVVLGVLVTVPGLNIGDVPEKLYNGMTQKCTSVLSLMGGAASRGYAKAHLDTLTSSARAFLRARIPIPFQIIHSAILLGTCRDTLLLKNNGVYEKLAALYAPYVPKWLDYFVTNVDDFDDLPLTITRRFHYNAIYILRHFHPKNFKAQEDLCRCYNHYLECDRDMDDEVCVAAYLPLFLTEIFQLFAGKEALEIDPDVLQELVAVSISVSNAPEDEDGSRFAEDMLNSVGELIRNKTMAIMAAVKLFKFFLEVDVDFLEDREIGEIRKNAIINYWKWRLLGSRSKNPTQLKHSINHSNWSNLHDISCNLMDPIDMDWLMLKDLYEQFIQAADSFCQTLIVVFIKPNLDKGTTSELGLGKGVCQVISDFFTWAQDSKLHQEAYSRAVNQQLSLAEDDPEFDWEEESCLRLLKNLDLLINRSGLASLLRAKIKVFRNTYARTIQKEEIAEEPENQAVSSATKIERQEDLALRMAEELLEEEDRAKSKQAKKQEKRKKRKKANAAKDVINEKVEASSSLTRNDDQDLATDLASQRSDEDVASSIAQENASKVQSVLNPKPAIAEKAEATQTSDQGREETASSKTQPEDTGWQNAPSKRGKKGLQAISTPNGRNSSQEGPAEQKIPKGKMVTTPETQPVSKKKEKEASAKTPRPNERQKDPSHRSTTDPITNKLKSRLEADSAVTSIQKNKQDDGQQAQSNAGQNRLETHDSFGLLQDLIPGFSSHVEPSKANTTPPRRIDNKRWQTPPGFSRALYSSNASEERGSSSRQLTSGGMFSLEQLETMRDLCHCPITQEVMTEPVVAQDGCTYEKAAISSWLATHNTSPLTNDILKTKDLLPNLLVKQMADVIFESTR